jgi:hypothetical protein
MHVGCYEKMGRPTTVTQRCETARYHRASAREELPATEDVSEQFEGLLYEAAQPLMVDWLSFFMSRLGYNGERCT